MFGKISILLTYPKVLDVYIVKRFPSNKLPMTGLVFAYFAAFLFIKTYSRETITDSLDYLNCSKCDKRELGKWEFK